MQMSNKDLLTPLSHLYILGVKLRHWLFDRSILRSEAFDIPVICIGNITVGGSGKSPMCEMILRRLTPNQKVALLSRGYGRKSRGYIEVEGEDHYSKVGDEPLQIKMKYPTAVVVVCEDRVKGVRRIMEEHPDIEMVIMDDGFQHRHILPLLNIIMVDANRPISQDHPLPLGSLRDTPSALRRANYFVVTKCPEDFSQQQISQMRRELMVAPHQKVFFSKVVNLDPQPTYPDIAPAFDPSMEVIALAGIGNPTPFVETLRQRYNILEEMVFDDHHSYSNGDIKVFASRVQRGAVILTTEKDSVKFLANDEIPQIIKEKLYYTPIRMQFIDGEVEELLNEIERLC